MAVIALCPYCNSTSRHHWPDGCIRSLQAEVAALKKRLAGETVSQPLPVAARKNSEN